MMDQEQKNMKLTALEDVMRAVRLLAGWDLYPDFIKSPGQVFDKYNDMEIEELYQEKEALEHLANEYVQGIHFKNKGGRITRLLKDDEQDSEDDDFGPIWGGLNADED